MKIFRSWCWSTLRNISCWLIVLIMKLQHSFLQVCGAEQNFIAEKKYEQALFFHQACFSQLMTYVSLHWKKNLLKVCIFYSVWVSQFIKYKKHPIFCFSPFPPFYSFPPQCIKPDRSINSYLWGYQVLVWRVRILVSYHNGDDQCICTVWTLNDVLSWSIV